MESVDIMPTLADLVNLNISEIISPNETPLEGISIAKTLQQGVYVKEAVFSQHPRAPKNDSILWKDNGIDHHEPNQFKYMGYSVRTKDWRYSEWFKWNQTTLNAIWDNGLIATELYDHRNEDTTICAFSESENYNIAGDVDKKDIITNLSQLLRNHFQYRKFNNNNINNVGSSSSSSSSSSNVNNNNVKEVY